MKITRKHIILVSVVSLLILSGVIICVAIRVTVPDDVRPKLGQELIEKIQAGTLITTYDCIIVCTSTEDMYTVIGTLPSESIKDVWDSLGGFHAFLTPLQIFGIARMDEVVRIDYNSIVTIT